MSVCESVAVWKTNVTVDRMSSVTSSRIRSWQGLKDCSIDWIYVLSFLERYLIQWLIWRSLKLNTFRWYCLQVRFCDLYPLKEHRVMISSFSTLPHDPWSTTRSADRHDVMSIPRAMISKFSSHVYRENKNEHDKEYTSNFFRSSICSLMRTCFGVCDHTSKMTTHNCFPFQTWSWLVRCRSWSTKDTTVEHDVTLKIVYWQSSLQWRNEIITTVFVPIQGKFSSQLTRYVPTHSPWVILIDMSTYRSLRNWRQFIFTWRQGWSTRKCSMIQPLPIQKWPSVGYLTRSDVF